MTTGITRRNFIQLVAAGTAGISFAPAVLGRRIRSNPEWKKIRFAMVGVCGRAANHLGWAGSQATITALCDIDNTFLSKAAKKFKGAKTYNDYREMFKKSSDDFDAVVVSTPDHNHYGAAMMALKHDKHVFCEKPLAWSVRECEKLSAEAVKRKLATQMGNQGNAMHGWRVADEYIKAGAVGDVQEFHVWTDRPGKWWKQGSYIAEGTENIPEGLNWDAWIGPAPTRTYKHLAYHPFKWRGVYDFGTGSLGDMACHTMNVMFQVMKPTWPSSVEPVEVADKNNNRFPASQIIKWVFPATKDRPGFSVFWYDGGKRPKSPPEVSGKLPATGCLVYGTKGKMLLHGDYNERPKLIPDQRNREFGRPKVIHPRSPGYYQEFMMAASGEKPWDYPGSNFTYAGNLTSVILLGNLAGRLGTKLEFDIKNKTCTNNTDANDLMWRTPRKGWEA